MDQDRLKETERTLLEVWATVLNLPTDSVGLDHNFFILGGDSISALQIVNRVNQLYELDSDVAALLKLMNIRDYAAYIAEAVARRRMDLSILVPKPRTSPLLASRTQARLWNSSKCPSGNAAQYSAMRAYRIAGDLGLSALRWAYGRVLERHEILRTILVERKDRAVLEQTIVDASAIDIQLQDVDEAETAKVLSGLALLRFDPAKEPVLKLCLLKTDSSTHILVIRYDDHVLDQESIAVFLEELSLSYESYTRGEAQELAPSRIQYADFSQWQHSELFPSRSYQQERTYWTSRLNNTAITNPLPPGYSGLARSENASGAVSLLLPNSLLERVQAFANSFELSAPMIMIAGFHLMVWQFNGAEVVHIAALVSNRRPDEIKRVMGYFRSTLMLTAIMWEGDTLVSFFRKIHETISEAFSHSAVGCDDLVEPVYGSRRHAAPGFGCRFVMDASPDPPFQLLATEVVEIPLARLSGEDDLLIRAEHSEEGLLLSAVCDSRALSDRTVSSLLGAYQGVLGRMFASPYMLLGQLPKVAV